MVEGLANTVGHFGSKPFTRSRSRLDSQPVTTGRRPGAQRRKQLYNEQGADWSQHRGTALACPSRLGSTRLCRRGAPVRLIRFRGHVPKGGYDVPHVPQEAGTPRTPAVH
jgi:hypothetical protein